MATSTTPPSLPSSLKWAPLPEPSTLLPLSNNIIRTVNAPNMFPCRRCLTDGVVGETMYLISYNPFPASAKNSPYQGPGPIFIHTNDCKKWSSAEISEQQRGRQLAVRAYDKEHMMVDSGVFQGEVLVEKAEGLFGNEDVEYLNVHYAGPGCFAVKVERA